MSLTQQDLSAIKTIVSEEVDSLAVVTNTGFEAMEKRFVKIDQRFEKVDQRFEKIDDQLRYQNQ